MHRHRSRQKIAVLILLPLVLLLLCWTAVERQLQPIVESYSENGAKTLITQTVNEAVAACLSGSAAEGIVRLQTDDEGAVKWLETDAAQTNALRIAATDAVLDRLSEADIESFSVPLGTLLGSDLLGGRGPRIRLHASANHAVTTSVHGEWRSAGINQTAHSLMLTVQVDTVLALSGSRQVRQSVSCEYLLTETVLVGRVPTVYAGNAAYTQNGGSTATP